MKIIKHIDQLKNRGTAKYMDQVCIHEERKTGTVTYNIKPKSWTAKGIREKNNWVIKKMQDINENNEFTK